VTVPRIGVDIVPLARAAQLVEASRRPVLERMLRTEEIAECTRAGVLDPAAVAGRLAVKEAVFKLLHADDAVVPWRGISVVAPTGRWPEVRLLDRAATLARRAGLVGPVDASITHDGDYAISVAAAQVCMPSGALPPCPSDTTIRKTTMSQPSRTSALNDVKDWILAKHPERADIPRDLDLIDTRLVDSLSFVEFVFVIEQASGHEIDTESLDLSQLRSLGAIERHFFS
jgi:phosphopantetheine--protein transferase-like protein